MQRFKFWLEERGVMSPSMDDTLAIIVDTNLFLECRALHEIPWQELGASAVELIVTRPVQQELDRHKKNPGGRTYKKALKAWTLLRQLVQGDETHLTIKDSDPLVTLTIMQQSRLQPDLEPTLDPSVPDDAIMLRLLEYQQQHGQKQVCLLTHDTGPMATAKGLGIPFRPIPESWLLEPQDDATTRENKQLKAENARLKSQEPLIEIRVKDTNGEQVERLAFQWVRHSPLAKAEINELLETLQDRFPPSTDFGSPDTVPQPELPTSMQGVRVLEFEPASESAISKYRDEEYPQWIEKCRETFNKLHHRLNAKVPTPIAVFEAINVGTRPAVGSLIRFAGLGGLELMPLSSESDGGEPSTKSVALPRPPTPPQGNWRIVRKPGPVDLASLAHLSNDDVIGRFVQPRSPFEDSIRSLSPPHIPKHDPDAFYWKDGRPITPREQISLTCDNWRHGVEAELFAFKLYPFEPDQAVSGAVRCEVHAENLSDPVIVTVPVTIDIVDAPTFDEAVSLVENLSN